VFDENWNQFELRSNLPILLGEIIKIGILALQGDVIEHLNATKQAVKQLKIKCEIVEVRTKKELEGVDGLIIPGGESTALMKLLEREGMVEEIKKIKNIFGTCAGTILLSKINLNLMDIEVERNAYGSQIESFEKEVESKFGKLNGIFIRAPKIKSIGKNVQIIANDGEEIIGVEKKVGDRSYLALTFHPELEGTKFHEYFIKNCLG